MNETPIEVMGCPTCGREPDMEVDSTGITLLCPQHGHMAMGSSLYGAKINWNLYVLMLQKKVA